MIFFIYNILYILFNLLKLNIFNIHLYNPFETVGVTHWDGMRQKLTERIIGRQLLKGRSVTSVNH